MNEQNKRWITVDEYIDIETGEIITKSLYERKYYIIKKEIKFENHGNYNIKKQLKLCREHRQQQLWQDSR